MASIGYVEASLGGLPREQRGPIKGAFDYVLDNLAFGAVEHQVRATNFQAYWITATTSSVANQEVAIAHGLGKTPAFAFPVLPLDGVNSGTPVLTVTRAADASRLYLSSASTSVAFALLVG